MRVSYVGMTPQTVTITQGVIKVVLKSDAKSLDEVVVTAMGISREKKALGYAVQDVKSDQLTRAANTDLAGALQGKVSGVDIAPSSGMPGASSQDHDPRFPFVHGRQYTSVCHRRHADLFRCRRNDYRQR